MLQELEFKHGIAGYEQPVYYQDKGQALANLHRKLAVESSICLPYFQATDQGIPAFIETSIGPGLILKIGLIGAFADAEIAMLLNDQAIEYVTAGTMGNQYPLHDSKANTELMAAMIGGYTESRLVVSINHQTSKGSAPIAGVQAQPGLDYINIAEGLLDPTGHKSTLSPFSAVYPMGDALSTEAYIGFINQYGNRSEATSVSMSRLYRRSDGVVRDMEPMDQLKGLSAICMAALGVGISYLANDQSELKTVVYDTHIDTLQTLLEAKFNMVLLANHGNVRATDAVMSSVLRFHYAPKSQGGYMEKIVMGYGELDKYANKSKQYLSDRFGIT